MAVVLLTFYLFIVTNLGLRSQLGLYTNKLKGRTLNSEFKHKIKSGNLSTDYNIETVLRDIEDFNFNTLNVPVAINVNSLSSSDMEVDSASLEKAKKLLRKLRWRKINIILEPYPWIENGVKYETEWNPEDKQAFFWNWENKVLKTLVKEIAVPYNVNALIVASNLVYMESYEDNWASIINSLRENYKGLVTYKTLWWYTAEWDKKSLENLEVKLNNKIFSLVDYISIASYFELSEKPENTVEELVGYLEESGIYRRKQNIRGEIEGFHEKWKKPIFFGELGFPRRNGAAIHPWSPEPTSVVNDSEQANCFEAYRRVFKDEWFLGFSVFAIGEKGTDKTFYPSEESRKVIYDWFKEEKSNEAIN